MSEERVQKALSRLGFGSRREIERLVAEGKVLINGKAVEIGAKVAVGDRVQVGKKRSIVQSAEMFKTRVLLYHKPVGIITTQKDTENRKTVFDQLPKLSRARWVTIGRLDINTSGLLLVTNNGELANLLMHPSSEIEREYAVRVHGRVSTDNLARLQQNVLLDDGPAHFDRITDGGGEGSNHWYQVVLKEGKNREVRRLWEAVGVKVSRLMRIRYSYITLPRSIRPGKFAELDTAAINQLAKTVNLNLSGNKIHAKRTTGRKAMPRKVSTRKKRR